MRILHLYRPRVPQLRAQAIQVLHTAAALARRGHSVTVIADRHADSRLSPPEALAPYGLEPAPGLNLCIAAHHHPGLAGLHFRRQVLRWLGARRARPEEAAHSVLYVRAEAAAFPWPLLARRCGVPVVLEAHEVESAQALERGRGAAARGAWRREVAMYGIARGVVTNCGGTLDVLESVHGSRLPRPRRVIHNATDPSRQVPLHHGEPCGRKRRNAAYVGSLRLYKHVHLLAEAARLLPPRIRLHAIGGHRGEPGWRRLAARDPGPVLHEAVPYAEVPRHLASMDALVLLMGSDLYGRRLASPLKLWDYLATGRPVVAPDVPSVREICGDAFHPFRPGDAAGLARAVERAVDAGLGSARLRTWDQRAEEVERFLYSLGEDCP